MSRAGFEPASANTVDLKSTPLDLSGTVTGLKKKKNKKKAPPLGFEPRTSRLTGARSNQLSYGGKKFPPGFEPEFVVSKTTVMTNYTTGTKKMFYVRLELTTFGS